MRAELCGAMGAAFLLTFVAACASPTERSRPAGSTLVAGGSVPPSTGNGFAPGAAVAAGSERSLPLAAALPRWAGGELPAYPALSRRLGEEGTVEVALEVLQDGEVTSIRIVSSSGVQRLDKAVLAAARTWRFLPRTGERGVDRVVHRFVFRLEQP